VALKRAVAKNLNRRLPLTDAVTLATLLDSSTKDLVELDQQSKIELLVEAVVTNDAALLSGTSTSSPAVACSEQAAVGSDDDSSMTVQEQQGLHIDELKSVSKRLRLLLKHRVESEPQEAVCTEVNAYLQAKVGDDVDDDPLIFWKNAKGLDHLKHWPKLFLPEVLYLLTLNACFPRWV